ncbi:MAG: ABC transporter permease [Anaerolineales bacterium]
MSTRHLFAVVRKEIQHIFRDRGTFILVLITPTLVLLLMTYALAVDIVHVPIALLDYDQSALSKKFVQQITAGDDLDLYAAVNSMDQVEDLLTRGKIKAAVIIDPEFSADLLSLQGFNLQVIIDGTEPETGGFAVDHIGWRAEAFANDILASQLQAAGIPLESLQPIDLRIRAWYNPSLKPQVDLLPGLLSIVLGFPAFSVALTLAREHEHHTLEQLLATPITRILLVRRIEHGNGHRRFHAFPISCPGSLLPGCDVSRFFPDRNLFSHRFSAGDGPSGIPFSSRDALCHYHSRSLPDGDRSGHTLALCNYVDFPGSGLHWDGCPIFQKETCLR